MKSPSLEVDALHAPFGTAPGLRDICFSLAPGERFAVVGPSGAGKSTLLRAIAGLAPVASGRIRIAGRDATGLPPERRGAVYLHQTPVLFPHLSVFENVAFALRLRRTPGGEVDARVHPLLEAVELAGYGDRMPSTLSGGQRHRIALARALAAEPDVLLLDEPLASLDPSLRHDVRAAILALQSEYGPAIVLVTHDLDEAALMGNRVAVLLDGTFAQLAPPEHLFASPASLSVARFLGFPNQVAGVLLEPSLFDCALGRMPLPRPACITGPAVAVFLPDALRLYASETGHARLLQTRVGSRSTTLIVEAHGLRLEGRAPQGDVRPDHPLALQIDWNRATFLPPSERST